MPEYRDSYGHEISREEWVTQATDRMIRAAQVLAVWCVVSAAAVMTVATIVVVVALLRTL